MVNKINRVVKHNPAIIVVAAAMLVLSPAWASNGAKGTPGRTLTAGQKPDRAPAFPVPIYKGNVLSTDYMEVPTAKGFGITATTRTSDEPSLPFAWYQNLLSRSDWTVVLPKVENASPAERSGNLLMLKASKDNTWLLIICSKMQRSKFTTVNVTTMPTN